MASNKHNLTTPDQILKKALEMEKQAYDFYEELALGCAVEFVRELLEKLRDEESKHVHMIHAMISRLELG
jgi:rubrerythrin